MSWKETSERVGEVIGGEVFNPWQHRRFLPAQFERDCREDPTCEKLVRYPWKWSETNSWVIRELKRMGTPETLAIAEEREKFFVNVPRSANTRVYSFVKSLLATGIADNYVLRIIDDLKDGAISSVISTIECELVHEKPDKRNYSSWSGYQFAMKVWQLKRVLNRISAAGVWDADSFRSAIECKEMYVKEGIYYYKKSRGESVSPEEVLAMSWSEVLEYRKSVAENLEAEPRAYGSTSFFGERRWNGADSDDLAFGTSDSFLRAGSNRELEKKPEKKPENEAVTTAIATMRNACAPGVKLVYDESKVDSVPADAGLEEVARILNFRIEKDDEPKSNGDLTAMSGF